MGRASITLSDGSTITQGEAVLCEGTQLYHDWVYHRATKEYKCRRCQVVMRKADLKLLLD